MFRLTLVLAAASVVLGVGIAAAEPAVAGQRRRAREATSWASSRRRPPRTARPARAVGGGNLVYHGGKVLRTNKTVAIYWGPAGRVRDGLRHARSTSTSATSQAASGSTVERLLGVEPVLRRHRLDRLQRRRSPARSRIRARTRRAAAATPSRRRRSASAMRSSAPRSQKMVGSPDPNTTYFVFTGRGVGSCYSSWSCAFSQLLRVPQQRLGRTA